MSENRKLLEMNVPMWFDGKSINEALFSKNLPGATLKCLSR